jgi:PadR family transcriptional regulator AphA
MGFAAPTGTVPSPSGPRRTVVAATDAGRAAVDAWLVEPVGHVREARSLLMLKLLFLSRRSQDPAPLLNVQRTGFAAHAARLADAAEAADGFDEVLIRWRLESTNAAIRFIDGLLRSG